MAGGVGGRPFTVMLPFLCHGKAVSEFWNQLD